MALVGFLAPAIELALNFRGGSVAKFDLVRFTEETGALSGAGEVRRVGRRGAVNDGFLARGREYPGQRRLAAGARLGETFRVGDNALLGASAPRTPEVEIGHLKRHARFRCLAPRSFGSRWSGKCLMVRCRVVRPLAGELRGALLLQDDDGHFPVAVVVDSQLGVIFPGKLKFQMFIHDWLPSNGGCPDETAQLDVWQAPFFLF